MLGAAEPAEAAAVIAAVEQFLADTAPAPAAATPAEPWQRAALLEGVARQGRPSRPDRTRASPSATHRRRGQMAVVKIIELVGSSKVSTDDAAQQALKSAQKKLRNIRAVDIVSTGLRGENLDEYRAHVRVAFLVETSEID